MTVDNRKSRIAAELLKGDEALRAATTLLDIGLFNDAVARMYYAAFHYATAALASVDVQAKSHRAMHSLFALHFIKPQLLPFQRAKELKRLQGYREAADYDADFRFDETGARDELEIARTFITAIRTHLADGGWLA